MRAAKELPQFVRDLLASPPRAGEGVNCTSSGWRVSSILTGARMRSLSCCKP